LFYDLTIGEYKNVPRAAEKIAGKLFAFITPKENEETNKNHLRIWQIGIEFRSQ
jgi:hypothetical protein